MDKKVKYGLIGMICTLVGLVVFEYLYRNYVDKLITDSMEDSIYEEE